MGILQKPPKTAEIGRFGAVASGKTRSGRRSPNPAKAPQSPCRTLFSPFYRGGQPVQREADFPKLFSSNLPTRYSGLRECASSGRDSNPRPSGPKPDALARLRYRSIFGTFQPIGRGLSITHLKMRGASRGLLVAAFCFRAGAARHSPLRVFSKAGGNSRFGRVNKGRKKIPNRAVRDFSEIFDATSRRERRRGRSLRDPRRPFRRRI